MPTEKANKFQSELASFPAVHSLDDRKNLNSGVKQTAIYPLDPSKNGHNALEQSDDRVGWADKPGTGEFLDGSTADVKSRVEGVLSRIKSEPKSEGEDGELSLSGSSGSGERKTIEAPKSEEMNLSSTADLQQALPGNNFKSVLAELERRRTELFAMARGAEARAREAEDKYKQAEARLERETAQRMMAEQRLREMEEEYLHRLSAAEAEELKRLEVEMAREDAVARLKDAEAKVKEAEVRVREAEARLGEEADMRALVESTLTEAEAKVNALTFAVAEAEHKLSEAENRARTAEDNARGVEDLISEAETIAQSSKEKQRLIETKLQQESEARIAAEQMRAVAEQKLKALEDELSSYLDADWSKMDSDLPQVKSVPVAPLTIAVNQEFEEDRLRLQADLEDERGYRQAAEEARSALEAKLQEVETELRKVEGKHRQAEAGLKKILRKQEAELRNLSEQVVRPNASPAAITWVEAGDGEAGDTQQLVDPMSSGAKFKLVSYGAVLMLLVVALIWALMEVWSKL